MSAIEIRFASAADVPVLLRLIRDLATYERAPDAVVATEADLLRHGFGPQPRFEALLALVEARPAGMALFAPCFSTWLGKPGLHLEDLFVSEWARGIGVGRRLLARLAAIAVERGCGRLDLAVLDWNPAREFYHRLGFAHRETWLPYQTAGAALQELAALDEGD